MEVFETYNTKTPAIALDCEDYGLVVRLTESGDAAEADAQPRGEAPGRAAGLQRHRHHQGHRASRRVRDAVRPLRLVGRLVRRHRQRHRHADDARGDAHPEAGLSAPEAHDPGGPLERRGRGRGRVQGVHRGPSRGAEGAAGAVQPGQRHRPRAQRRRRWTGACAGARQRLAEQDPHGVPRAASTAASRCQSGRPAGGGSDDFSFGCHGLPAFGLGATPWDYSTVTWHTERDTYDKVVFDDLRYNATLTAMLVYLRPRIRRGFPLDRVDLAAQASAFGRGGGAGEVAEPGRNARRPRAPPIRGSSSAIEYTITAGAGSQRPSARRATGPRGHHRGRREANRTPAAH